MVLFLLKEMVGVGIAAAGAVAVGVSDGRDVSFHHIYVTLFLSNDSLCHCHCPLCLASSSTVFPREETQQHTSSPPPSSHTPLPLQTPVK